jgi:hypothetical protein
MAGGFRRMRSPDADMNTLWEMGTRDGTLAPRNLEEFAGEGARSMQGVRQAFKDGDYVHGLQSLWLGPMSKSESLARAYTYTTATEAARMAGFTNLDDIHRFAREVTQNSMYMYGQAYRPGLFNNPVGSVMGLFQNWYFNYMGSLLDYVGAGVKHGYWTPLLWQQGSLAAIGGISATPLYGLANAMSEEFSDKNLMRNMYEMMDEEAADGILYGLPAYMLGVAVTPSLAVDPVRSLESIWSPVMYDRMAAMKNTFGMGIDQWARSGVNPLMSEDFRRGLMKTFAPRTLHRIYQSFMDTGIESISTGYPILKNPSVSDKIWYSMGLSPLELAKANREANMLYENKMARRAIISTMGNTYSEAMDRGDSRAMWEVIQAARYQGIDISSVMKSAATRSKKGNTDLLERSADPATKYRLFGAYGLKP